MRLFVHLLCFLFFVVDYAVLRMIKHGPKTTKCIYYNQTLCNDGRTEEECNAETECDQNNNNLCYVLWSNNTNGTIIVKFKGCFIASGDCTGQTTCVDKGALKRDGYLFCCCEGDNCNKEFYWEPTPAPPPTTSSIPEHDDIGGYIVYVLIPITIITTLLVTLLLKKRKLPPFFAQIFSLNSSSQCPPSPAPEKLRPIQLIEVVARGKYGSVWKGTYNNELVAVKIMNSQNKQAWLTEQEVFNLPSMNHENILHFVGAEKHGDSLHTEFWLITSYHELGSLQDFLKVNIITWEQLCHITYTLARGLTHLHEEISEGGPDSYKPAIAHRDLKSSNILLKSDLTACIADFGLALIFKPLKVLGDTHGQVGTWRYMAPEVLEGAINFSRDAFLRIDMYACGLVLWELANRCCTEGIVASEYKMPFEEEVGAHPSLEEVQDLIVQQKYRPRIKPSWRRHAGFSLLSETIEECWDQDAEARISASCIMERIVWYTQTSLKTDTDDTNLLFYMFPDNAAEQHVEEIRNAREIVFM